MARQASVQLLMMSERIFLQEGQKTQVHYNPLSPHDLLKHHFTSLYTDLLSYN